MKNQLNPQETTMKSKKLLSQQKLVIKIESSGPNRIYVEGDKERNRNS